MLAIKLQRIGRKHQPSYRVVVAEKKSKLKSPPVEDLGSYSTFTKVVTINKDRAAYWLGVGAQPTLVIYNLFVKQGIIKGPAKRLKMPPKKAVEAPAAEAAPAAAAEAPAEGVSAEAPAVAE